MMRAGSLQLELVAVQPHVTALELFNTKVVAFLGLPHQELLQGVIVQEALLAPPPVAL